MVLKRKKILADKINSLINVAPQQFGSDDEAEETKAKVVEPDDESDDSVSDIRRSEIRVKNVQTLDQDDERYAGKKVSRKDLYESSDGVNSENEESENEESMEEEDEEDERMGTEESSEHDASDDEMESSQFSENESGGSEDIADEDEDNDDYDIHRPGQPDKETETESKVKTMSDRNVRGEIEKGNCVRTQLKLWESLLEVRIKLQKCLLGSNQMPQYDTHKDYRTDVEFMKKTNEAKDKLRSLLDNLLKLQTALLKQYPETKNLGTSKKRKLDEKNGKTDAEDSDEEIPSDTEDEAENEMNSDENAEETEEEETKNQTPTKKLKFSDYEKILSENHKNYAEYRNSVIQKWNDKTRVATGNVSKGNTQTALKQIEFALNDKLKLRKRTQLKRSEYAILGKKSNSDENDDGRRVQEHDPEIYDDDDFYHQLLRDLIEYKSSGITDPIQLSKQWIQLQSMRNKMKRKIDTRATKGRRIRYNVHNKLVNFMAPITVNDTWTELAKNELYHSLFGKIKAKET